MARRLRRELARRARRLKKSCQATALTVAQMARYAAMRYKRAVEKLRILAETCERVKIFWSDTEPFLKAVYAFGEVDPYRTAGPGGTTKAKIRRPPRSGSIFVSALVHAFTSRFRGNVPTTTRARRRPSCTGPLTRQGTHPVPATMRQTERCTTPWMRCHGVYPVPDALDDRLVCRERNGAARHGRHLTTPDPPCGGGTMLAAAASSSLCA